MIASWTQMIQLNILRFVGLASAIVGLVSYALSSSFNHLFGEWNLLKIFLYSFFSFIICLLILFARLWQHSISLRFKAHSAFLVLTITSVYSFFSDKIMNGKPDAYSLISCAAFALMSLSLSRQIQCGFDVDLMYFYLGCLIVQLMKIKLLLSIIGIGYSYCLIIFRSSFSNLNVTQENQFHGLEEQQVVIQVDSKQLENISSGSIIQHFRTCQELILQRFLTCMNELKQNNSNIGKMLLQEVEGNYKLVVTDHNFIIDALSNETINHLNETVKSMVNVGFEKECYEIYSSYRKEWLEDLLINKLLALGKMGLQEYVIGRWIKSSKVALRILFPSERQLYNSVFSESTYASSSLYFSRICCGATIQLLNFADSFANQSPSAWRLFKILDLFETLCDLIPDFESLFHASLVNEAIKIKNRLAEVSRDIFMEFGKLIFVTPDADLDCWADGGVHPMTSEASGYILMAFWSRVNLERILLEYPLVVVDGMGKYLFFSQMEVIMVQFERKLEAKSKVYEDPALRYFFMMNNLSHVEYKLKTFWDYRFFKNKGRYFELYCNSSWNKVKDFLKMDINSEVDSMKDNLSLFNEKFREMCGIQSTWCVFDEQLRKHIIISLKNMLLPTYENFIVRFENVVGKNADEYIMYGISDIQDQLNHLFQVEDVDSAKGSVRNQLVSYYS